MPSHTHLVLTPADTDGLHKAVGEAHRRYTRHVNFSHGWRGYLWQGRFASFPMDEAHLYRADRNVERNPVAANHCRRPEQWSWSSVRAHLCGKNDELVDVMPMQARQFATTRRIRSIPVALRSAGTGTDAAKIWPASCRIAW